MRSTKSFNDKNSLKKTSVVQISTINRKPSLYKDSVFLSQKEDFNRKFKASPLPDFYKKKNSENNSFV